MKTKTASNVLLVALILGSIGYFLLPKDIDPKKAPEPLEASTESKILTQESFGDSPNPESKIDQVSSDPATSDKKQRIRQIAEPILEEISSLDKEREELLSDYQSGHLSVEFVQKKNRQLAERRNQLVLELIKKQKSI
jgi:hypothetical protein